MKAIGFIILLVVTFILAACAPTKANSGYQFGDITRLTIKEISKLSQARTNYCESTSDSALKAISLVAIHAKYPLYPEEGICTDLEAEMNEAAAKIAYDSAPSNRKKSNQIRDDPQSQRILDTPINRLLDLKVK